MKKDYRGWVTPRDLLAFRVKVEESDLLVLAKKDLRKKVELKLLELRGELISYIESHPEFLKSLGPLKPAEDAPEIVRLMCEAAGKAGVGPFAAVAGAVAQMVGEYLLKESDEVVVENGGDIFMHTFEERVVALYAGKSPFSGKIGLRIPSGRWGIATSSGTVGHSLSFGRADAAVVVAESAPLADAFATALGNRVKSEGEIQPALEWISTHADDGVIGALVIVGDRLGVWGKLQLTPL